MVVVEPSTDSAPIERGTERPGVSVVIPVYNSEESLPELVARLHDVLPTATSAFELILVNDGSRDRSWEVVRVLAERYPAVRGVELMRNYGQHNALLAGIRMARQEVIVTMDDDLQHPPEEIPAMLADLAGGHDVVYGSPSTVRHGLWRGAASRVTKLVLQGAMGAESARRSGPFRAFRTRIRDAFSNYQGPYVNIDVLLTWGTYRFHAVDVRHDARRHGQSAYTLRKLIVHSLNMVTGFSTLPLQIASMVGFAFTAFGMLILAYVLGRYLWEGAAVPGFAFLASVIAIFSGAQLFALGVMGEYLARLHFRMMDRPTYSIRSTTDGLNR